MAKWKIELFSIVGGLAAGLIAFVFLLRVAATQQDKRFNYELKLLRNRLANGGFLTMVDPPE